MNRPLHASISRMFKYPVIIIEGKRVIVAAKNGPEFPKLQTIVAARILFAEMGNKKEREEQ